MESQLAKLARAVEQSPSTVAITDPQGNLEYVNPKFTQLTGYLPAEVLGHNPRLLKSGDKGPEEYKGLWATITSGQEWRGQFHNKKKNGEIYHEAASISPIRDLNGKTIGYVKVAEDITERVKLEKLRDDLTNMIVHDLKNPLTGISSTVELFLAGMIGQLTEEQRKFIGNIQVSSKKLLNLIMDLLQVSKMEESALPLQKSAFPAGSLRPNFNWLDLGAQRENKQLELDLPADLNVTADQNILTRVIENLVGNALKHTPAGGKVTLKASRQGNRDLFEVIDNGEGIPAEFLPRIFDKFFKVESSTLKSKIDTGLGLTFCKLAVEAHGGEIGVESTVGQGSRFYFYLPA
jgi:PAS domain S-box-containing protein